MKTEVESDCYSSFVAYKGYIFRPMFPLGYDPLNGYALNEGEIVDVSYKGHGASYARITTESNRVIFWMNHGKDRGESAKACMNTWDMGKEYSEVTDA